MSHPSPRTRRAHSPGVHATAVTNCALGFVGTSGTCVVCTIGYYCPGGAAAETPCNAGHYCGTAALSQPSVLECNAGYYCPSASSSANQTACPIGGYCLAKATGPEPCTAGRFCPTTGIRSLPTLLCTAGYYCPAGSSSTVQIACDTVRLIYTCSPRFHPRSRFESPFTRLFSTLLLLFFLPPPQGMACPTGSGSQSICPAGQFCPGQVRDSRIL